MGACESTYTDIYKQSMKKNYKFFSLNEKINNIWHFNEFNYCMNG